jgi:ketosteroid isomerase-like protein
MRQATRSHPRTHRFAHNGAVSDSLNHRIARELWNAVSNADVDRIERLSSDGLVWHTTGRGPRAGTYRGRQVVLDHLAEIGEHADRFDSELEDILVGVHYTALLYRVRAARLDRKLDTRWVLLLRIADERLAEAWSIPSDQHAVDEFWAA